MTTHEDQVTDPLYWNWVKGGLGLKYLSEGLESFVDDTIKDVQTGFLDDICKNTPELQEVKCTECTTANVLSCPIPGMCKLRKRGKISICSYHDKNDKLKTSRPCPNSICDKIPLKIRSLHRYEDPSWKNTNAQNWCSNHFEIGKCFLPKSGYEDKTATSQTDSSGIINMAINCLSMQTRLDFYINPPNDILSKLLKTQNSIFHSTSCTLTKEQLDSYIDDMVTLLEDKKTLLADPRAQTAVLKLKQLKNEPFHISPQDELHIRKEAMRAVEEKKNEALQDIQEKQEEVIDLIKETHETKRTKMSEEITAHTEIMASQCDDLRSSIQTLRSTQGSIEGNIDHHEHRLKAIEHTFNEFKTSQEEKLTMLIKDFSEFKEAMKATTTVEHQHKDRIEYIKRKQELQTKLCEMYKSHIKSTPLSPVLDGLDASVDDLFVELVICDDKTHEPKSDGKKVEGYKDIFVRATYKCKNECIHECDSECEKEERLCKYKNMYVIGDAGMGKTTWCMKMVSTWVDTLTTVDEATNGRGKFSDEHIMSEIDILFFVSLRHAVNDGSIIDMVTHQLFEEFPEMDSIAKDVLRRESKKCLIILDGLDEWRPPMDFKPSSSVQHPGLPSRQDLYGCPILTTTRPWKLDEVRLSNTDIDRAVKIQGLEDRRSLINNIICHLNEKAVSEDDHINKGVHDFDQALKRAFKKRFDEWQIKPKISYTDLDTFFQIPLLLVFMVCLWYDEGKFELTWAANFTALIEFLIRIAERPSFERRSGRLSVKGNLQALKAKWSESSRYLPDILKKKIIITNYSELILKLSQIAFGSLFNESTKSTLVFTEESLENELKPDELDVAVKVGIISKSKVVGKTLKRLTSLSFMHKSVQEYFASLFLIWKTDNDDETALNRYKSYCSTTEDIKEMETILLFVCGLSPSTASKMSKHVANVTQYDRDNLLDLKNKCVLEMQAAHGLSFPSKECPIFTYGMNWEMERDEHTLLKLAETNKERLVSLHLSETQVPVFLSDMTHLQELSLENVNVSVQQYNTLDLSQLRELQTIHLQELKWKHIVILDGLKLQNIVIKNCCSVQIKTLSNCRIAKETMSKENRETGCKIKHIILICCRDCEMSIEGDIFTIDNVSLKSCKSCIFTMQACKEKHGTRNTSTGQRSHINNLVIIGSKNLTLGINNEVEVKGVQIMDSEHRFKDDTACINHLIQQLPRFKQIDIKSCRFDKHSSLMLPNDVEDIAIPIEWTETVRHLSNLVRLRLHGTMSGIMSDNLTEILPSLTRLKSFESNGYVTTTVMKTLTNIYIERIGLRVYHRFKEISQYLPRIQNLLYLELTDIDLSNCQHVRNTLLHMPQLKTLSISLAFVRDTDRWQPNDKNIKELQLKMFSVESASDQPSVLLPKAIINYLKHCRQLHDLRCPTHMFKQLVSEPEIRPILTQLDTFKGKYGGIRDVSLGDINKMSNVRHGGVFVNLEHLETLKLKNRGNDSSNISISREFVDSLPLTHQPITIEISGCRLEYDVEQYLRSRNWLQSVERTVTHMELDPTLRRVRRVYNMELLQSVERMITNVSLNRNLKKNIRQVHSIKILIMKKIN